MEEKGFRVVCCPYCEKKLRLAITPANYGKKIEVTCPKTKNGCGKLFRTTIPMPAINPTPQAEQGGSIFKEVFGDLFKFGEEQ